MSAQTRQSCREICLIRPPCVEAFRFSTTTAAMPLGLAYIAAALEKAGNKVHILDGVAEAPNQHTGYIKGFLVGLSLEEIVERLPPNPLLIGITVIFTHEWPAVARLVNLIKAVRPRVLIVLGGEHVTAMPEFCLATCKADIVVQGEGEETIVELADVLRQGQELSGVNNIGYRNGAEIVINKRSGRRCKIDDIPQPAWHLFDVKCYNDNKFIGGMEVGSVSMPMLATRGCPYQCTFCAAPNMWTPSWMARDPVKVVEEIQQYMEVYGATDFCFQDLTAFTRKDWLVAFCKELLARDLKITWQLPTGTRSEAIDAEAAEFLNRTGMKNMNYAPESGSETTRRLIKKKMTNETMERSIRAAVDANLNVGVFTIIGFPHDKPEHLAENLPFLESIGKVGVNDISVGFYMALPGTELFYNLYDAGKVTLDRRYFSHILQASDLYPATSYVDDMNRFQLAMWKFRFFLAFYGAGKGLMKSVFRGLKGIFSVAHSSRLETAVHNAATSLLETLAVKFRRRWITREEEQKMFEGWDAVYRSIHRQKLESGVIMASPVDSAELHKTNVIPKIRHSHGAAYRIVTAKSDSVVSKETRVAA